MSPEAPQPVSGKPFNTINGQVDCGFLYGCLSKNVGPELEVCREHIHRTVKVIAANPISDKIFVSTTSQGDLTWRIPLTPTRRAQFINILRIMHEHSADQVFFCGFEGFLNTQSDLGANPTEMAIRRLRGSKQRFSKNI
jgi:hypothetical protein